ncbi:hypothetical protein [Winogradskyella luteola]|uniref:Lipocalin-like domain-containing protein n=1 Tax=Winogradskyella luteola TaxID=2828330 RepID=A0A9X1JQH8_9FLAO|nr:hypothetical protein [Winogradskyella luteola]MBV7267592.1 hypothetical protein [Winogradskyella luteola]
MKTLFTTISILCLVLTANAQDTIKLSDFESIDNTNWKGTLTYTDYQSGELETIDATMQFKIDGDKIKTSVQYTYEPNKNYNGSVKIRKNGTYFGNEKVVSFTEDNGTKVLVTTHRGKDDNRKADMYITHTLTDTTYIVSKEVVYLDTKERLTRNTYNYTKIQ